ncbi:hypothetical protein JMUB6875_29170 [Nocardia sp. JMUB6875]|uniref:hypothetical protein n=1 Tax=Nocardia sp. JMUB6875 TaxID=3158170 RepID=UPI0032E57B5E
MPPSAAAEYDPAPSTVSLLEFADAILRAATSPERIGAVVTRIIQDHSDIGAIALGPGGLLSARVVNRTDLTRIEPDEDDLCRFGVCVPMLVWLDVGLGRISARFVAGIQLRTRIALVPDRPCALLIQHTPIGTADIAVSVKGQNLLGWLIARFVPLERLVATQVATHADALLSRPDLAQLTRIDVLELIDRAWDAGFIVDPLARNQGIGYHQPAG